MVRIRVHIRSTNIQDTKEKQMIKTKLFYKEKDSQVYEHQNQNKKINMLVQN